MAAAPSSSPLEKEEGRTVFFSSHLLEEIERVCDHIAMLHEGRLVFCGPLDEIKLQHRRVTLRFAEGLSKTPLVPGALSVAGSGREWTITCNGARTEIPANARALGAEIIDEQAPSLNEIFVAYAGASGAGEATPSEVVS